MAKRRRRQRRDSSYRFPNRPNPTPTATGDRDAIRRARQAEAAGASSNFDGDDETSMVAPVGPTEPEDIYRGNRNAYELALGIFRQYGLEGLAPKILEFAQ